MNKIHRIKSINEFHRLRGLSRPEHPLISLVDYSEIRQSSENNTTSWVYDFYSISLKRNFNAKIKYGQQEYDFDEGIMFFISPGQVFKIEVNDDKVMQPSGWMLLVHPDFLWNTLLANFIKRYDYFDYTTHEALFVSEKEEKTILHIFQNIKQEYQANIDKFSQNIIIAQIELLLSYAERFYQRQFITRKITNHRVLDSLEKILTDYFNSEMLLDNGLPTVQYISEQLNISPNYLSGLLKNLTGQSTQQHIHEKLIEKAKQKLSTTNLSVSEIAYELGFGHPQSFSKFFKGRTNQSPVEFRQALN